MPDSTDPHCRDLLPWYAADLLSPAERETVTRHLATCASCRHELAQWQAIGAAARRTLQHAHPAETDAASWRQVQAALSSAQSHNGKHATMRGDRYMEFGNQSSQTIVAAQRDPARRALLALAAVALVAILGVAGFALFAPHTPLTSRLHPIGVAGGTAATTNGAIPSVYLTPGTLVTPASLPTGTTIPISDIQTSTSANTVGDQLKISPPTALFHVDDAIHVSFKVQGAKANDVISIKWYMNGTDLTPALKQVKADCCFSTITDGKAVAIIFTLQVTSPGFGKAEIFYNTALADAVVFDVIASK